MKVCILSMQMVDNMGSLLQSFALKRILEEMNVQVEFLDIASNEEDNNLLNGIRQQYVAEREKDGLFGKISKIDKYTLNRFTIKIKSNQQNRLFNEFRVNCLETEKKSNKYDLCKRWDFKGTFYMHLRGMSETIYFVHMYFVAFCSLVLYKESYHNFKS